MERTVLPPACGEETLLPGVACIGCAAAVSYHQDETDGFSVCVIASSDEVNLLGPDRGHSKCDEKLLTKTLWRPPRHVRAGGGGGTKAAGGVSAVNPIGPTRVAADDRHRVHVGQSATTAGSYATNNTDSGGGRSEGNAKIVALLAFLLHQDDDTTSQSVGEAATSTTSMIGVADDTMCVFVAWADDCGNHHVSFLLVSLLAALSSTRTASPIILFQELDALPLEPDQRVLRLFYSHHVVEGMRLDDPSQLNPLHLILCSGYRLAAASDTPLGHGTSNAAQRNATDATAETAPCRTASGPTARLNGFFTTWSISGFPRGSPTAESASPPALVTDTALHGPEGNSTSSAAVAAVPPLIAHLAPNGEWIKAPPAGAAPRVTAALASNAWAARPSLRVQRATESEMPAWLRSFVADRVVCCFDVMPPHGIDQRTEETVGMRAAAGTTDGRVYVLTTHGPRLLRRLAGPIADAAFVVCESVKKNAVVPASRGSVVTQLLAEARARRRPSSARYATSASGGASLNTATPTSAAHAPRTPDVALVVLDSVGRVVYFLTINKKPVVTPQVVCDVPQLIHLADRETNMLTFVDAATAADGMTGNDSTGPSVSAAAGSPANARPSATAASSRSFLDISTLRHFFSTRKQKQAVPVPSLTEAGGSHSSANASAGATAARTGAAGEGEALAGACAGHLLSRGLLRIAQLENVNGLPELVISTHGQLLVSLPYDMQEQRFYVAGFTITPTPMHYVQFVDIFGTGCEEIVFAGLESVLVARRSRGTLRERALLLLKLLEERRQPDRLHAATSTVSDEALYS